MLPSPITSGNVVHQIYFVHGSHCGGVANDSVNRRIYVEEIKCVDAVDSGVPGICGGSDPAFDEVERFPMQAEVLGNVSIHRHVMLMADFDKFAERASKRLKFNRSYHNVN